MIAMAVAGKPSLVIADEPTTALDVTVQAQILELLRSLRDEIGCSVLLITHDLGVAAQVADRIAVLYAGRLAELGPAGTVLAVRGPPLQPGADPVPAVPDRGAPRTLATLPGEPPDPADPPPGCAFAPRCSLATDECLTSLPDPVLVDEGHLGRLHPGPRRGARGGRGADPGPGGQQTCPRGLPASPEPGRPAAAQVQELHKTFRVSAGRRRALLTALRGVDLEVAEGEAVALVGESGSGKSTMLRIIAGLERADAGQIELGPGGPPADGLPGRRGVAHALADRRGADRRTPARHQPQRGGAAPARGARRSATSGCPRRWPPPGRPAVRAASASGWPWPGPR